MVVIPVATPFTSPAEPMLAVAGNELLHVPPVVTSLNVVDDPAHKVAFPLIEDGNGFTVTSALDVQPDKL